jgi:hypothetical protein
MLRDSPLDKTPKKCYSYDRGKYSVGKKLITAGKSKVAPLLGFGEIHTW